MTAESLLRTITQAMFLLLFVSSGATFVRRPQRRQANVALFFGLAAALILVQAVATRRFGDAPPESMRDVQTVLLLGFPFVLLRLSGDFTPLSVRAQTAAFIALICSILLVVVFSEPAPAPATLSLLAYFIGTQGWASVRLVRAGRNATRLSRRRVQAIGLGTALIVMLVLLAIPSGLLPRYAGVFSSLAALIGLASGVAFFVGFAPPRWLKATWQSAAVARLLSPATATEWLTMDTEERLAAEVESRLRAAMDADAATLWLIDSRDQLTTPANRDLADADRLSQAAQVVQAQTARMESGARADRHPASTLWAPVSIEGRTHGAIALEGGPASLFEADDLQVLETVGTQVALVVEQRTLAQQLAAATARETTNRLKEDFLSSVAHDLQTPLQTIMGETELMLRRLTRTPQVPVPPDRLQRVLDESRRMRGMVRELLDLYREERDPQLRGERAPVDLVDLCRQLLARQRAPLHTLQCAGDPSAIVLGDRSRLDQLLANLIENAIKYSPDGGPIVLYVATEAGQVVLEVRDRGIGISETDLPFVFERFWRSPQVSDRSFAGLGLGLSVCQSIVQAHNGVITVSSRLGEGSTFRVVLPTPVEETPELLTATESA